MLQILKFSQVFGPQHSGKQNSQQKGERNINNFYQPLPGLPMVDVAEKKHHPTGIYREQLMDSADSLKSYFQVNASESLVTKINFSFHGSYFYLAELPLIQETIKSVVTYFFLIIVSWSTQYPSGESYVGAMFPQVINF